MRSSVIFHERKRWTNYLNTLCLRSSVSDSDLERKIHQVPLPVGFSRQEYWTGLPFPPPGDLPDPGIELESLRSPALAGGFFTTSTTWEAHWLGKGKGQTRGRFQRFLMFCLPDFVGSARAHIRPYCTN